MIVIAVIVLGFIGFAWWGRGQSSPATGSAGIVNAGKGALVASETRHDFGVISMANGNVEKVFRITNPTEREVTLAGVVTSCMCTVAYIESGAGERGPFGMPGHGGPVPRANETIGAGESRDIRVVYDPNAHGPAGVGPINRFIDLTEAGGAMTRMEIKAVVTP